VQPPATIEDLSALLAAIVRGESSIVLGPKARTALGKIIDLRGNPALLSITALAEKVGINASTITRLARSLGYSGFSTFQEVLLAASLTPPGEFYLRQAQTALDSGDRPSKKQASQLCRESQANIDHFIESFDTQSFDKAVELIAHSPRIAVHGIRQFHSFASFLVYGLRMIRSDVSLLIHRVILIKDLNGNLSAQCLIHRSKHKTHTTNALSLHKNIATDIYFYPVMLTTFWALHIGKRG